MIIVYMLIYRMSDDEDKRVDAISIFNQDNENNKQYTLSKCQEFVLCNHIETVLGFGKYGFDFIFSRKKRSYNEIQKLIDKSFKTSNT